MSDTTTARTSTQENNTQHVKITRKKQLYLFMYVAEVGRDPTGLAYFKCAAHTRLINFKTKEDYDPNIHKVHMPDLTKFSQIQTTIDYWVEKYGGEKLVEVKEVSIFSHGGLNGPIIYLAYKFDNMADLIPFPANGEKRNQLVIAAWQKINFYWGKNARFNVMGCQTSMHPKYDFAKVMSSSSNCKDVIVSGQPSWSYPSYLPDHRVIKLQHAVMLPLNANDHPFYMLASKGGTGKKAITKEGTPGLPLNFWKNGKLIQTAFQSIFNDHRERKTKNPSKELDILNGWLENKIERDAE